MAGLKFKTEVVSTDAIVSLAHDNGVWYVNAVKGSSETRVAFTDAAMDALVVLYQKIKAEENPNG